MLRINNCLFSDICSRAPKENKNRHFDVPKLLKIMTCMFQNPENKIATRVLLIECIVTNLATTL